MSRLRRTLLVALTTAVAAPAWAKNPEPPETAQPSGTTFIDHTRTDPFWAGAEFNSIFQGKPSFSAPYTGTNSLLPNGEAAISGLLTLFSAYRPHRTTEII